MGPLKTSVLQELTRGIFQLAYPNMCWICRESVPPDQLSLCSSCRKTILEAQRPGCPRCAMPVGPYGTPDGKCPSCRDDTFAFSHALCLAPYVGLMREVIIKIKQADGEPLAEAVAETWVQPLPPLIAGFGISGVVPVPLHWWRRWRRGYNQSDALARVYANALKLPCYCRGLRRVRDTPPQTKLSATQRRENVRGAFAPGRRAALQGKTVLLVDDVMTTGSTVHEAARALRQGGATNVIVAVLARATV